MKNYSLQPTVQNVYEQLKKDSIGRKQSIVQFINLLESIDENCSIAISGNWGSGKTFFAKQIKLILDAFNPFSTMDDSLRTKTKNIVSGVLPALKSYATLYYDAWMYDNDDDPILSLVHAAIIEGQSDFTETKAHSLAECGTALFDALSGTNLSNVLEKLKGKDTLSTIKANNDIQGMVRQFLDALIEEHGNRLVIFIDELDRCKPDYAIRFLERIKHYFNDERIVFVFSVSLSQLQHTVKGYYGPEFDATRYLDKFFDLRLSLPEIDPEQFLRTRLDFVVDNRTKQVCVETIKYFGFSLREIERYIRLTKIAVQYIIKNTTPSFSDQNTHLFSSMYIVPVLIGLQMANATTYEKFISGQSCEPWVEILNSPNLNLWEDSFLNYDEIYNRCTHTIANRGNPDTIIETLTDRLTRIYNAIFGRMLDNSMREVRIGDMAFTPQTKRNIEMVASLLSPYCLYNFE